MVLVFNSSSVTRQAVLKHTFVHLRTTRMLYQV